MGLSRKRKKELRKLQSQANHLWEEQQTLAGQAAGVAREAGRQLSNFSREEVAPQVQAGYEKYAAPYVERGVSFSRRVMKDAVVPATGALVGGALSIWDAANDTRARIAAGKGFAAPDSAAVAKKAEKYSREATKRINARLLSIEPEPAAKRVSPGAVIALILGVAAAAGVLYAAWQTLRADDELWVADDPLAAPEA